MKDRIEKDTGLIIDDMCFKETGAIWIQQKVQKTFPHFTTTIHSTGIVFPTIRVIFIDSDTFML